MFRLSIRFTGVPGIGLAALVALAGVSRDACAQSSLPMLHAEGTQWVDANGAPIILRGCNLGNWLLMEMWMNGNIDTSGVDAPCDLEALWTTRFGAAGKDALMDTWRDNFITEADIQIIKSFDMNVIRLPVWYTILEDDANPYVLKPDAFKYLDRVIDWAEAHGIYTIIDLHGAPGGQNTFDNSGCLNPSNQLWGNPQFLDRTVWLWEQIATYYRDRGAVAAYDILNEPWGSTDIALRDLAFDIHDAIRAVDPDHIVVLPGYTTGFEFYGVPGLLGMSNVVHTMHWYPGFFGWGAPDIPTHTSWLTGDVYNWRNRVQAQNVPFFVGEMNVVAKAAGGGEMMRHSYDTYASFGWGTTMWSYKLLTGSGGIGGGIWGMVGNPLADGAWRVKADTWACDNWNSAFADACVDSRVSYTAPAGSGPVTVYLTLKTGACCEGSVGVAFDNVSLTDDGTGQEMVTNGGFGSGSGWNSWTASGALTRNYNYTGSTPTGGAGPALLLSGGDGSNGGVVQALSLERGRTYTLSGVFRDVSASSSWTEIYLRTDAPVNDQDYVPGSVYGNGISLQSSSFQQLEDYFDGLDELDYVIDEDLRQWLTTSNAPSIFTPPTIQNWFAFGSIDGWALAGTEMTESPQGSDVHRRTVNFGTPPAPEFWKALRTDYSEEYPGPSGFDAWVKHGSAALIDLVFDRNAQADGWFPDANLLYQDPVYTAATYVVVGGFQSEIGDPSDYYANSALTVMSDDGSSSGDVVAGDGIYTLTVTIPSPGTYNFTAVLVDRAWNTRITTIGPVGDVGGAGEVSFSTTASNQDVRFLCDIRRNRVRWELGPLITRAQFIGTDNDLFSDAARWDIGTAPLNVPGTRYQAEILNGSVVPLRAASAVTGDVDRLRLDQDSRLVLTTNDHLTVTTTSFLESDLHGTIEADGPGARFGSMAVGADLARARLHAKGGGVIDIPAASYRIGNIGSAGVTVFSADGGGSRIDLSSVSDLRLAEQSGAGQTLAIEALNGGVIDLSAVTSLVLPVFDDKVAFRASGAGSELRFARLELDANGFLDVTSQAKVNIGTALDLNSGGQVDLGGGGSVDVGSCGPSAGPGVLYICTDGLLTGAGTVTGGVENAGTIAPGSSTGEQIITGSFVQQTTGVFELELGGTADFDRMIVSDDVTLQGTLDATTVSGYSLQPGDWFEFITCGGTRTGTFAHVNLPPNPWTNVVEYLSDRIVLRVDSAEDTDLDGLPDWWEELFFGSPTGAAAEVDSDGDGSSNLAEFIAHTEPMNSGSVFAIEGVSVVSPGPDVKVVARTEPARHYRIEYTDTAAATGMIWKTFVNTNVPVGAWTETNADSTTHVFTDDAGVDTTGGESATGIRRYRVTVERP